MKLHLHSSSSAALPIKNVCSYTLQCHLFSSQFHDVCKFHLQASNVCIQVSVGNCSTGHVRGPPLVTRLS